MEVVKPGGTLLTVTEHGYGKRTEIEEYRVPVARRRRRHQHRRPPSATARSSASPTCRKATSCW